MSHSNRKVYSLAKVPFYWERGESSKDEGDHEYDQGFKMPPPPTPCPTENHKGLEQDLLIPLPSCPFQSPLRRGTRKGIERWEDPFLCSKYVTKAKFFKDIDNNKGSGQRAGKSLSKFSCKYSCGVRDDSLVRMVLPPAPPRTIHKDKEPWLIN